MKDFHLTGVLVSLSAIFFSFFIAINLFAAGHTSCESYVYTQNGLLLNPVNSNGNDWQTSLDFQVFPDGRVFGTTWNVTVTVTLRSLTPLLTPYGQALMFQNQGYGVCRAVESVIGLAPHNSGQARMIMMDKIAPIVAEDDFTLENVQIFVR